MPHVCLNEDGFYFPPLNESDEEGLLIIGGRVSAQRVLEGYQKGVFPWYDIEALPLWWSPDPRFVLFPDELHISRSMNKTLSGKQFDFRVNAAFEQVIEACAVTNRKHLQGTWLTPEMKEAYKQLFYKGYGYSAEAWQGGILVGGLYGLIIGKVFFAESMFHTVTNASKFALINCVQHLKQSGVELIDCQVYSSHVASMGARLIDRAVYVKLLNKLT